MALFVGWWLDVESFGVWMLGGGGDPGKLDLTLSEELPSTPMRQVVGAGELSGRKAPAGGTAMRNRHQVAGGTAMRHRHQVAHEGHRREVPTEDTDKRVLRTWVIAGGPCRRLPAKSRRERYIYAEASWHKSTIVMRELGVSFVSAPLQEDLPVARQGAVLRKAAQATWSLTGIGRETSPGVWATTRTLHATDLTTEKAFAHRRAGFLWPSTPMQKTSREIDRGMSLKHLRKRPAQHPRRRLIYRGVTARIPREHLACKTNRGYLKEDM
ncbi:hypothetical protein M407DRAFT_11563 [Tulasnella calospora MUT 4182]|uniref:Uncharacterized protein n=1 Tax=Tulasnella calospora MUT 4182 TaxID=1051891 RepID=A0A0C3KCD1_9AGAM|nr:hypothetical protein M407DRAFT_11563 [Tulasnella calospora MUT 4182]